ncbi:MAG: epimerase [Ferruginibacter sp.]|nr:epimerase [Ferruginibacter sp.]
MKINPIITGATGMVGEGVLHECLSHPDVGKILVINRKPCGVSHPRLTEIIHDNFFDLSPVKMQLAGYDSCLFCLGVSSVGKNEAEFTRFTYDLTMHFAKTVLEVNPGMSFCYISGSGTNAQGKMMWARVKGKTENDLMALPFKAVYAFRPGFMKPTAGLKNTLSAYKYFGWLFPLLQTFFSGYVSTLAQLGQAMIRAAAEGYPKTVLEVKDIVALANK